MNNLLINLGLYIAGLGGFVIPVIKEIKPIPELLKSVETNIAIYNRARRLYIEYNYISDLTNKLLKLDEKLKSEFDTTNVNLEGLYSRLKKESESYVWANSRTV